jgi:hypothetical protein
VLFFRLRVYGTPGATCALLLVCVLASRTTELLEFCVARPRLMGRAFMGRALGAAPFPAPLRGPPRGLRRGWLSCRTAELSEFCVATAATRSHFVF